MEPAAAVEAGVPSVVVPLAYDQWFWAQRLQQCGVSHSPVTYRALTVARLAAAILKAVDDSDLHERAMTLSAKVGEEDGVAQAVEILEHC